MISDILSDAAEQIRQCHRYHAEAYAPFQPKIAAVLAAMDQLRAELDAIPPDSAQAAINRSYDAATRNATRAAAWDTTRAATTKATP